MNFPMRNDTAGACCRRYICRSPLLLACKRTNVVVTAGTPTKDGTVEAVTWRVNMALVESDRTLWKGVTVAIVRNDGLS